MSKYVYSFVLGHWVLKAFRWDFASLSTIIATWNCAVGQTFRWLRNTIIVFSASVVEANTQGSLHCLNDGDSFTSMCCFWLVAVNVMLVQWDLSLVTVMATANRISRGLRCQPLQTMHVSGQNFTQPVSLGTSGFSIMYQKWVWRNPHKEIHTHNPPERLPKCRVEQIKIESSASTEWRCERTFHSKLRVWWRNSWFWGMVKQTPPFPKSYPLAKKKILKS